jgi:hypothetical protein
MVKFTSDSDAEYQKVLHYITEMARNAPAAIETVWEREIMSTSASPGF